MTEIHLRGIIKMQSESNALKVDRVVGRITNNDFTVWLRQRGMFVYRQDTGATICHISRLRTLAEFSPRLELTK